MSRFKAPTTPEVSQREILNQQRVRDLAVECMVVLKNDGTLPLKTKGKIALYGNGARATVKGGTGSGDVYVRETVNVEDGLQKEGFIVTTKDWIDREDLAVKEEKEAYNKATIEAAIAAGQSPEAAQMLLVLNPLVPKAIAKITEEDVINSDTDTAVYVLARNSGEGKDRSAEPGDYEISEAEAEAMAFLAEKYDKFIVLLNIGGVIDTKPLRAIEGINAVVLSGQMGNMTGITVADLLSGAGIPSGKLTDTWAENYSDYPSSEGFSHNDGDVSDEYYTEGIFVGYRYFDTFNVTPAYEFGYGKTYTQFAIDTESVAVEGDAVIVKAKVTNIGTEYPGKEIVQVYVSAPEKGPVKPYQELRGFKKTRMLQPGESEVLEICMKAESFASYCAKHGAWVLPEGEYVIRVGNSSRNTHVAAIVELPETVHVQLVKKLFEDPQGAVEEIAPNGNHWTAPGEAEEKAAAVRLSLDPKAISCETAVYPELPAPLPKKAFDHVVQFDEVVAGTVTMDEFVADLSDEELAYLMVGNSIDNKGFQNVLGSAAKHLPGAAGETTEKLTESRGLKIMELCDGPAGLRLSPEFIEKPDGTAVSLRGLMGEGQTVEGIHHYQYLTAIPIAMTLAASWNLDLIEAMGDIVGSEMEEFGASLWLAPGMNIHRNPLCGRNFEYYSEDPLLAGKCAAADTIGVQKHPGYGTTIKHYLANNQEDNRMFTNSHINERAIREIYARNFQITVVESQPMSLMTSYNLFNGTHAANQVDSVTHLLRDEWGFQGMVMTDWLTTSDFSALLSAGAEKKYDKADAAMCVVAQNDLIEPGEMTDFERIMEGLAEGVVTRSHLERNARNILTLLLRSHVYADKSYYEAVQGKCITFK
ncbi:MAG: glycoside hydrolase family 3 C-terminal domain-containing protein [Clostridiales bacterium]|nr:glycoside hydrolase family 3 C-terminal domain-containing protein [Clostridiales bacterium]